MATLDTAEYVFAYPDPNGLNSAPDPTVWATAAGSGINVVPMPGLGLGMADPDNSAHLLYYHATPFLSGSPASTNFHNMATFRVRSLVPYVADGSGWFADAIGWRMIADDGTRRLELALSRSTTGNRQVRIQNCAVQPIPFPWDNELANSYQIDRLANGDFVLSLISADPSSPVVTQTIPAGMLPASGGTPLFAWGTGREGGGAFYWQEVHAEVNSAEVNLASFQVTQLQVRTRGSNDKIKVNASFSPAAGQSPNPTTQPIALQLLRSDLSAFWPGTDVMPITEFTFNGTDTYSISSAEKTRTGIQSFDIKAGWSLNCVDTKAALALADYSQVLVRFQIGQATGQQFARMVENPVGSGNWQLA